MSFSISTPKIDSYVSGFRASIFLIRFPTRSTIWITAWLGIGIAGEPPEEPVVLSPIVFTTYAAQLRTGHPALRATAEQRVAARAASAGVRTFADPTLKANVGLSSSRGPRKSEEGNLGYGFEQELPIMGKERAAQSVAAAEADEAAVQENVGFEELRRDLVQALLQLALSERELSLTREDNEWHSMEVLGVRARYESGQGSALDALRFESEHARKRALLRQAKAEVVARRGAVNRALGQPPEANLSRFDLPARIVPPTYSPDWARLMASNSPAVRRLEAERRRGEQVLQATRRSGRPDFAIGVDSSHYSGDGGWRQGFATLSMTLPWFNRAGYRHDIERDQARLRSIAAATDDAQLAAQAALFRWITFAAAATDQAIQEETQVLPRTESAFQAALSSWTDGRATLSELFETRRSVIEVRRRAATALASQWEALNEIAYLCGTDIESLVRRLSSDTTRQPAQP